MRLCPLCKEVKPLSDFPRNITKGGYSYRCKQCHREWQNRFQVEHPEYHRVNARAWRISNPEKTKAHHEVRDALKAGAIAKPSTCTSCNEMKRLHAHHDDYSLPMSVIWLCALCHKARHKQLELAV